jgi:Transposase, Mutator family
VAGRDGGNSRNGHRSKTVLTEVGPVEIDVPRDRDATFEPKIVGKRKRRRRLDLLHIGGADIGRLTLQPGWRWSNDVKPAAGTELCEAPHFQYHVSGTLRIQTADGDQFDATPAKSQPCPPGMTRGWSARTPWSSSTGGAHPTTPAADPASSSPRAPESGAAAFTLTSRPPRELARRRRERITASAAGRSTAG